jgi:hypothetical protein
MHEPLSLCNEFGFTGLLSQVTDFLSGQPVIDDGTRKDASDITEEKLQIRQALCSLQEVLSRLANHEKEQKALKRKIVGLRQARQRESEVQEQNFEQERIVCFLQKGGLRGSRVKAQRKGRRAKPIHSLAGRAAAARGGQSA